MRVPLPSLHNLTQMPKHSRFKQRLQFHTYLHSLQWALEPPLSIIPAHHNRPNTKTSILITSSSNLETTTKILCSTPPILKILNTQMRTLKTRTKVTITFRVAISTSETSNNISIKLIRPNSSSKRERNPITAINRLPSLSLTSVNKIIKLIYSLGHNRIVL